MIPYAEALATTSAAVAVTQSAAAAKVASASPVVKGCLIMGSLSIGFLMGPK